MFADIGGKNNWSLLEIIKKGNEESLNTVRQGQTGDVNGWPISKHVSTYETWLLAKELSQTRFAGLTSNKDLNFEFDSTLRQINMV